MLIISIMVFFTWISAVSSVPITDLSIVESPTEMFEKAESLRKANKTDSALIQYSLLVELNRKNNDNEVRKLVANSLLEIGRLYYIRLNNYANAYRTLQDAEEIARTLEDTVTHAEILLNIGNIYNMYEYIFPDPEVSREDIRGRKYYEKALSEGLAAKEWGLVNSAYINLVMLDMPFKVDSGLHQRYSEIINSHMPDSAPGYYICKILNNGMGAVSDRRYHEARDLFTAFRDSMASADPRDRFMADFCLAAVEVNKGDYKTAIDHLKDVFEVESDINLADVYIETYDLLSRLYGELGDKNTSDEYRLKFYEAKDLFTKDIATLEPTRLGIEIDRISRIASEEEATKRIRTIILVLCLLLIVVLVSVSCILIRKNRQLKLKNNVIYTQMSTLLSDGDRQSDNEGENQESCVNDISIDDRKPEEEKYKDSSMTSDTRRDLIEKIEKVMGNIDEICDNSFSLIRLTSLVESNTSYVSRAINEHYGMTFGNLLNKYRIREACRRMSDIGAYGNLTIDAISESVGFNTRATFTKAFRNNVGMLPSEFMRLARDKQ